MTLLESVVTEYNAQRLQTTPALNVNALTAGDASDVFRFSSYWCLGTFCARVRTTPTRRVEAP